MSIFRKKESNKKKEFPHVYIVLIAIIFIAMVLTYIIPAGEFSRIEGADGRMLVDPDSFKFVDQKPVGIFSMLQAVPKGLTEVSDIVFFILIVGGFFGVMEATGAIEAGVGAVTKKLQGREKWIIPIMMIIFSIASAVFGMAEEKIPFVPIMVMLTIALGYDSLTGVGLIMISTNVGFMAAFMNPFTVGVAQGIAGLPLFSAMGFRIICYVVFLGVSMAYVFRHANKVKKDPTKSPMYEIDSKREDAVDLNSLKEFTNTHKLVLLVGLLTIIILVWGVVAQEWFIQEIAALFLGMSLVIGLVGKLGLNGYANSLGIGFSQLAGTAIIVGFARAILVVLTDGAVMDTILMATSDLVGTLPKSLTAIGMLIFQGLLSFLIPSGSGQAAVAMPIMAPLADLTGLTRQTAVLAFQFGEGAMAFFTPTSGVLMACLGMAKVPWQKWAKYYGKLVILELIVAAILLIIATMIGIGPF